MSAPEAEASRRYDAVIYDHDGTLVDSLDVVVAATNAVLAQHGVAAHPREVIIAGMVYPTGPRLGGLVGVADTLRQADLAQAFYTAAHAVSTTHARVYEGIESALGGLSRRGVVQGVVSNNQGSLVRRILANLGLATFLHTMIGEEDMPAPKPDARGLQQAVTACGAIAKRSLYVGDTVGDLHTAQAAGLDCVGVTWGITPRQELERHGFVAVIDHPQQMIDLVFA